jgi:hypothetical protein
MASFNNLIQAAYKKGFKIESFTNIKTRWGTETTPRTIISIEIQPFIWYTWEMFVYWNDDFSERVFNEEQYMFFQGRYNQTNGASQKTFRRERKGLSLLGL